jgi:hypothetical protein
MPLLTSFEIDYIYQNSKIEKQDQTVVSTYNKIENIDEDLLYDYKICSVQKMGRTKIGIVPEPTTESLYYENETELFIDERDGGEVLLESGFYSGKPNPAD